MWNWSLLGVKGLMVNGKHFWVGLFPVGRAYVFLFGRSTLRLTRSVQESGDTPAPTQTLDPTQGRGGNPSGSLQDSRNVSTHPSLRAKLNPAPTQTQTLDLTLRGGEVHFQKPGLIQLTWVSPSSNTTSLSVSRISMSLVHSVPLASIFWNKKQTTSSPKPFKQQVRHGKVPRSITVPVKSLLENSVPFQELL